MVADARGRAISNQGIEGREQSDFSTEGVNTLRTRQNGRYFPDDILKCIFLNDTV